MAGKVLFFVYIPDEDTDTDEDTDSTDQDGQNRLGKNAEKTKLQEPGKEEARKAADREVLSTSLLHRVDGDHGAAAEGTQAGAVGDTSMETEEKRKSAPELSVVTSKNNTVVPNGIGQEALKHGNQTLIRKKMLGKELTDDYWDFDLSGDKEVSALPEAEEDQEPKEGVKLGQPLGNGDVGQQTAQEKNAELNVPPQQKETQDGSASAGDRLQVHDGTRHTSETEDMDDNGLFFTCPSPPITPIKDQEVDLSGGVNAQKSSEKPTSFPASENTPAGDSMPCSVSEHRVAGSDQETGSAVNDEKMQQKGDTAVSIPVDGVATLAKHRFRSASTGGINMVERTKEDGEDQPAETKRRRRKSDSSVLSARSRKELIDFLPNMPLKAVVENCLKQLGVKNVCWWKCLNERVWQVTFIDNSGLRCEEIMLKLTEVGVGRMEKSSVSVVPVSIHQEQKPGREAERGRESEELNYTEEQVRQMELKKTEFQKSIKSRLVVGQVVKSVQSNAEFTFDYVMFILLSSLIAAVGLLEDSALVLGASVFISPLMGPLMAGTFGTVIKNNDLRNLGIRSELIGLGMCLICGFVCGLVPGGLEKLHYHWRESAEWPTLQMSSRGALRGLVVGMLVALPSGVGVALSILAGHMGSLVGVAISASLLPPAVNAGMLWSSAVITAIWPPHPLMQKEIRNVSELVNGTEISRQETVWTPVIAGPADGLHCPQFQNNEYIHIHFCNTAADLAALGGISLLLTVLNIVCIFCMGVVVLKIKEVSPRTSTHLDQDFFKRDIKIARESYTTAKGPQSAAMGRKWLEEYKALKKTLTLTDIEEEEDIMEFQHILQDIENSPEVKDALSRFPSPWQQVSEEMAPEFHEAAVRHMEKSPRLDTVLHTSSYPAFGSYGTVRFPWNMYPSPPSSACLFPPPYSADGRMQKLFSAPSRLVLTGRSRATDPRGEGSKGSHERLKPPQPQRFHVTPLKEAGEGRDAQERATGKKMKFECRQSRSPKKKGNPGEDVAEVTADEVPLLELEPVKRD